jgi:hypothetical protein
VQSRQPGAGGIDESPVDVEEDHLRARRDDGDRSFGVTAIAVGR